MNKSSMHSLQWPKNPPPLSEEQSRQKAEFLKIWHETLPQKYALIEDYNHSNALLRNSLNGKKDCKTLEIGTGLGAHIYFEDLTLQEYTALEIRADFVDTIKSRFPKVKVVVGDIQERTEFPDGSFDRILAIHVLEHLHNLPLALVEIKRLLKPNGTFVVVIPCEGGLAYSLARKISAQRLFEKTFNVPYLPIVKNEHVNEAWEILHELSTHFNISKRDFWPLKVPIIPMNLVISLCCTVKS
jgi:SAM-dependent methyltransferase